MEGPAGEAAGDEGGEARSPESPLPPAPPELQWPPHPGEGAPGPMAGAGRGWELLASGDELRGTLFLGRAAEGLSGRRLHPWFCAEEGDRVSGKQGRLVSYGPPRPPARHRQPPPRTLLAD